MTLGTKIRIARIERALTGRKLATMAGISFVYLSVIENDHKIPSYRVVVLLAKALGVTVRWLREGTTAVPEPATKWSAGQSGWPRWEGMP